ncbi:MAG: GTPase [Deltaproteobacteria bacterium]|nr:GTPase [Deltaproteobacteria bacterium]
MAIFNYQKKEIGAKIVYYGPALCGKTTNVQYIHLKLNPKQRGELVSLATDSDRTLFFDFLPIELENIGGFKTRFHIYTVPGQVYYNSTRKAVLTGVDGIIFVADSQRSMTRENIESFQNLKENLQYYNRNLENIPLIMQYNKRDMPDVLSIEELNKQLNPTSLPFFESVAVNGTGVLPTLTNCCKKVLQNLKQKSSAASRTKQAQSSTTTASSPPLLSTSPPPMEPYPVETGQKPELQASRIALSQEEESPVPPLERHQDTPLSGGEFKPEIVRVGKTIINNPYTITIPVQLAVNENHSQLLSVDLSLTINHLLKKDD